MNKPLNLFIIGPSGCGKTTQAKMIAEKYNLTHFSTGQILRNEAFAQTEIGLKAKVYTDKGNWVPDDIVINILKNNLTKIDNKNFIIDGFPRVLNQGVVISEYLESKNSPCSAVILLDVTYEEINTRRQRLGEKFQDNNRTDNTSEAILEKQRFYNETINPIVDHFKKTNQLVIIDGNRPIEPIFDDICKFIDKIIN